MLDGLEDDALVHPRGHGGRGDRSGGPRLQGLAVSVPGGLSYVIELGALLDLVLVVIVAAAFTQRIHVELGTGDTELLRGLRD